MVATIKASRRAFTLIELLVVMVVIAVLAAIILPKFTDQGKRSKEAALKNNLALLRTALATCQTDTGLYPAALNDLTSASTPSTNGVDPTTGTSTAWTAGTWHGPYLQTAPGNDPVSGTAYTYVVTTPNVGKVSSSASGNDTSGNPYSGY